LNIAELSQARSFAIVVIDSPDARRGSAVTRQTCRRQAHARLAPCLRLIKDVFPPVTVGLILASGAITTAGRRSWCADRRGFCCTATFFLLTSRNPLWTSGAGTLAGVAGNHLAPWL
jgi:hypothetical protein